MKTLHQDASSVEQKASDIRSGPKRAGWMIQGKENEFLVGLQRGVNWYEVQYGRKRGALREADVKH
jgi:hypothetical protein